MSDIKLPHVIALFVRLFGDKQTSILKRLISGTLWVCITTSLAQGDVPYTWVPPHPGDIEISVKHHNHTIRQKKMLSKIQVVCMPSLIRERHSHIGSFPVTFLGYVL